MNDQKTLEELAAPYDRRLGFRVLYVSNPEQLEILNNALRKEWTISKAVPDYKGGIFYTLEQD